MDEQTDEQLEKERTISLKYSGDKISKQVVTLKVLESSSNH